MTYRLLVADPPWKFGDRLPGKSRGAEKNYPCMAVDEIKAFPIPPMAADAILLLWRVASMQQEALDVARAWGFTVKTELVWRKLTKHGLPWFGMGRTVRSAHETCLVAARGRSATIIGSHGHRSVFEAKVGRHSEKPDEFYSLAESLVIGPRVEIFARKRRAGWTQFGNQLEDE